MAIAFDAASEAHSTAVTSITKAHTCTGSNRLLVAYGFVNQSYTISGITYNGTSMTAIQNITNSTDSIRSFYLIAPSTGSNNAVVSFSGAGSGSCIAMESITGAKQSAQPDSNTTGTQSSTPKTTTITLANNGAWPVIAGRDSSSGGVAASTNCTDRGLSQDQLGMFDSGSGQNAGSFGMTCTSPVSLFTNMVAFQADANNYSQSCSDALSGAADSVSRATTRSITDALAMASADSVTTVKVLTKIVSDALSGCTDTVTRTAGKAITDALSGVTDTVNCIVGRSITDALAMAAADSVTATKVAVKSITDALAMAASDTVTTAGTFIRSISDALSGVTDSISIRSLWNPRSKPTSIWTPRSKS